MDPSPLAASLSAQSLSKQFPFFYRPLWHKRATRLLSLFSRRHGNGKSAKILLHGLAVTKLHVETSLRMVCKMIMMC